MSGLRLAMLGGFELRDSSGDVVRLPTRKAEALLAYLCLSRHRSSLREHLTALLWSQANNQNARASLRQTLSLVGKALGRDVIETRGRAVILAPGAIETDVDAFDNCVGDAAGELLVRTSALYRGEMLDGLIVDEAGFEEWLANQRARFRERAIEIRVKLLSHFMSGGQTDQAIETAMQLLAMDPMMEPAHRALMSLYADQGRRANALRQYQVCVETLRRELGTSPEQQTRDLYNRLLRQRETMSRSQPMPSHSAPLVGREQALAECRAVLERAKQGAGHVITILGEAGIGKTRLTEELMSDALQDGVTVLKGRCFESQQLFPFSPWREIFRSAGIAQDELLLRDLIEPWRSELSKLLPELATGTVHAGESLTDMRQLSKLFEAVTRVISLLAQRDPLLLIVEDLHWADEMSLRLLAAVGRSITGLPVLLVTTVREEELADSLSLKRIFQELEHDRLMSRVSLSALSRTQTAELVMALARSGEDALLIERLAGIVWTASEGNPFVAVECVRAEAGRISGPKSAKVLLPGPVREIIQGQIDRLGPAARDLAAVASVIGCESDFSLLQRAAGTTERQASEALEELVRRQVMHAVGEHFDFVHDRIRKVVDEALLVSTRKLLHGAVAQALEAIELPEREDAQDRLAYHYSRSNHARKAILYLTRFAERAARAGAHGDALTALDEALMHLQKNGSPTLGRERFDLLFRKTRSLLLLGRLKDVSELLGPEQSWVDAQVDPQLAGAFYFRLGATQVYLGDYGAAEKTALRALDEASSCGDSLTMGKAHFLIAFSSFWGHPEAGIHHGEQAVALLEGTTEEWWLGQSFWILGLNLSYRGRFTEGLSMEERACALGDAVDDRRLKSSASWATGFISTLVGDWDRALSECHKGVALSTDPLTRMTTVGMLALAHVERCEPRAAIPLLEEVIPQTERFHFSQLHGLYLGFRGEAALQLGKLAEAENFAKIGIVVMRQAGYFYGVGWTLRILARIANAKGQPEQARGHFEEAIQTFEGMGAPYETGRTHHELAQSLEVSGQPRKARAHAAAATRILQSLALSHYPVRRVSQLPRIL